MDAIRKDIYKLIHGLSEEKLAIVRDFIMYLNQSDDIIDKLGEDAIDFIFKQYNKLVEKIRYWNGKVSLQSLGS